MKVNTEVVRKGVLWDFAGTRLDGYKFVGAQALTSKISGCSNALPEGVTANIDIEQIDGRPRITRLQVASDTGDIEIMPSVLSTIKTAPLIRAVVGPDLALIYEDHTVRFRSQWFDWSRIHTSDSMIWIYGRLLGLDPTKYLATELGLTKDTAAKRVLRARKARDLPPANPGRKG